jgi:enoyl-CoA hydratase/carnithine racemase
MAPISFKPKGLTNPEPPTKHTVISYPSPGVLLVRINRPKDLNCLNQEANQALDAIWSWLDAEPSLSVGIITGTGRAFCAGADLKGSSALSFNHASLLD